MKISTGIFYAVIFSPKNCLMCEKSDEKKNLFCLPSENSVQILPESGSALGQHSPKMLDPDPHIINADLKHWEKHTLELLLSLEFFKRRFHLPICTGNVKSRNQTSTLAFCLCRPYS
jgi:hypothetical protein